MRCPNCGNEVGPQESFCGQCGTPNMPPARPTEMVNTPSPRSGLASGYNTNMPSSSFPYSATTASSAAGSLAPNQQQAWPTGPQQQSEFYQQPTEAISTPSPNNGQLYPAGYPQQGLGTGPYTPQIQPFQTGSFAGTGYQQPASFSGAQGYGYPEAPPGLTPRPPKQRNNGILVFATVCLTIALLTVIAFGALYLFRDNFASKPQPVATATAAPTSAPSPTAVSSPSPTATDTPTPSPSPTSTVAPTPTPDAGFAFCGATCTSNGFLVEYPLTPQPWQQGPTPDNTGTMFTNPSATDQYAAFKTPGVASQTANDLVNSDLQANFASKPDYMPPASLSSTTIGGETWIYGIAHYQYTPTVQERIEVFATVHQGKAYIIELQASESQFDTVNTQYFEKMLGSFQFVQSTP